MTTKVFYHNDMDGYGSAYAVWKSIGDSAQYISIDHSDKADIKKNDLVYFVDFSLKRPEILKHLKVAEKIIIIDHHKSAKEDLDRSDNPDNLEVTFDMKKSGAVLSWEYFHTSEVPLILKHIQDYDIWQFKIPKTEEFSCYLKKHILDDKDKTFKDLDNLPDINTIYKEGKVLLDIENKEVQELLKTQYKVHFEGYTVGVVDSNELGSKIGNALAKKYKFGVVKSKNGIELRSIGSFDVSKIAKKYKGGGHVNAAGFPLPKNKIWRQKEI